jgi:hypothetical protein
MGWSLTRGGYAVSGESGSGTYVIVIFVDGEVEVHGGTVRTCFLNYYNYDPQYVEYVTRVIIGCDTLQNLTRMYPGQIKANDKEAVPYSRSPGGQL